MKMDKKTFAIVVLAGLLIGQTALFLWQYGPSILIRPFLNMRNLQKAYPLINDVVILDWRDEPCGYLRRGTVIHPPCVHDLGHTDLGDIDFRKVYVRLQDEAWRDAVGDFDDIKSEELAGLRLYPATNWSPFANKVLENIGTNAPNSQH
jgi:hypothetical protein